MYSPPKQHAPKSISFLFFPILLKRSLQLVDCISLKLTVLTQYGADKISDYNLHCHVGVGTIRRANSQSMKATIILYEYYLKTLLDSFLFFFPEIVLIVDYLSTFVALAARRTAWGKIDQLL